MKSKLFVQFYQKSATDNSKLIEALGDRSVIMLDGRFSIESHLVFCREECARRQFAGFSINRGAFSSSRIVYQLERVNVFEPEINYEIQIRMKYGADSWSYHRSLKDGDIKSALDKLRARYTTWLFRAIKREVLPL